MDKRIPARISLHRGRSRIPDHAFDRSSNIITKVLFKKATPQNLSTSARPRGILARMDDQSRCLPSSGALG